MAKSVVVQQRGVTLSERIAAIREDADTRHVSALADAREVVDDRITELVKFRALSAVDAVLMVA